MKRINVKKLSIAGAILFGVNIAFGANPIASYKAKAESSFYKNKYHVATNLPSIGPEASTVYHVAAGLTWSETKGAYAFNKAGLNYYGSTVIIDEHRVATIREDLKDARANKDKTEKAYLRRKLKKAKLDLFRDQMHFIVNKEALRQDYLLVIADQRRELSLDRTDLCKAKADVRKDKTNSLAIKKVEMKKKEIEADKLMIKKEKASLNVEMESADKIVQ
jgi:hypothetical protein